MFDDVIFDPVIFDTTVIMNVSMDQGYVVASDKPRSGTAKLED